jgi:hypothetical protein
VIIIVTFFTIKRQVRFSCDFVTNACMSIPEIAGARLLVYHLLLNCMPCSYGNSNETFNNRKIQV